MQFTRDEIRERGYRTIKELQISDATFCFLESELAYITNCLNKVFALLSIKNIIKLGEPIEKFTIKEIQADIQKHQDLYYECDLNGNFKFKKFIFQGKPTFVFYARIKKQKIDDARNPTDNKLSLLEINNSDFAKLIAYKNFTNKLDKLSLDILSPSDLKKIKTTLKSIHTAVNKCQNEWSTRITANFINRDYSCFYLDENNFVNKIVPESWNSTHFLDVNGNVIIKGNVKEPKVLFVFKEDDFLIKFPSIYQKTGRIAIRSLAVLNCINNRLKSNQKPYSSFEQIQTDVYKIYKQKVGINTIKNIYISFSNVFPNKNLPEVKATKGALSMEDRASGKYIVEKSDHSMKQ